MSLGFFYDSRGSKSYGRLASFVSLCGGIIVALAGRLDALTPLLTAAVSFYAASKAQQAYTEGKSNAQPQKNE